MTERSFGTYFTWFTGEVVSVDDPDKAGRARLRIHGAYDDPARIKDEELPWARPMFPITNPSHAGVAGPQTGLVKGSVVMGFWVDDDRQIPVMAFTMGRSGTKKDDGSISTEGTDHDFPSTTRSQDFNQVVKANIIDHGAANAQFTEVKTIGALDAIVEPGKVVDQIKTLDPNNIGGAIPAAPDAIKLIKKNVGIIAKAKHDLTCGAVSMFGMVEKIQNVADEIKGALNFTDAQLPDMVSKLIGDLHLPIPEDGIKKAVNDALRGVAINPLDLAGDALNKKLNQVINGALGEVMGPLNGAIGQLEKAEDFAKLIGSHGFMMNQVMKNLDQGFSMIKAAVKEAKGGC